MLGSLIALQQMLSYSALGMREGVLIHLSSQKPDEPTQPAIYSSSIAFAAMVGLLLPLVGIAYGLAVHGQIDVHYLLITLVGGVSVLNEVLINLNRYEGRLMRVSFCETSYNLLILVLVFSLHRYLNVTLVLTAMLVAICFSAVIYLTRLRFFSIRGISWSTVKSLVAKGFFSSVLSAVLIVINLIFILVAQRHLPREAVGQFVFANNIATLLLVSLNAFSWAMTSRSIGDLASAHAEEVRRLRVLRTDLYMRVGIAGALILALGIAIVLPWVTERYGESGRYVLLFVALQSFQLIVFTELNFLMMKNKVPVVIGIFALTNAVNFLLVEVWAGDWPFHIIMTVAVICTAIATSSVVRYATRAGLGDVAPGGKYTSVLAIVVAVLLFYALGIVAALSFAVLFFAYVVGSNWKVLRPA